MNLNHSLQKTPIAVIGVSALFADAKNVEEYWTNIIQGRDSITEVPESRWLIEDYYDADFSVPDKTYSKVGGFLPDIDFNPMEFGLPPNILEVTDVSQLLALVAARDAFEDAGYGKKSAKFTAAVKEKTGVVLGVGGGQKLITPLTARLQYPIWEKALRSCGIAENDISHIVDKMKKAYIGWNENSFPGMLGNVISGRITNRFDLGGINSVVDAACAASLSAVKMSLSELVEGRSDMMLTGGVDTDNSIFMYMSFSKTPAFSKVGKLSPFSDTGDGMLIGEGVGMLVLKRLADAERDGDNIYAVVKGVGTSSDGRFKSVYAPRPSGQALAMNRTYEDAGFDPATVGLVEAHGTGTPAGDPAEFTSMNMVFSKNNEQKQHIALGSVKSQIGHTKAAAGAAGMIKAVLALHHKVLPPMINVNQPKPEFDIKNTPFYLNSETRPWLPSTHPRRASLSAFGFGGINVHIAMEEYQPQVSGNYRLHEPYKTILLQEDTAEAISEKCQTLIQELKSADGDLAFAKLLLDSKNIALENAKARLGFVVQNKTEAVGFFQTAIQNLKNNPTGFDHPKGIYFRPSGMETDKKVVALFSGQGSQYVGMGKELANAFPDVFNTFVEADKVFEKDEKEKLTNAIFPIPVFSKEEKNAQEKALTQTHIAQAAIGTVSMGMYKVLHQAGFQPNFAAGHSFGELTALWAAGVYDDETFLQLAETRGEVMAIDSPQGDAGTMAAVKAPFTEVEKAITNLNDVKIANVNSDKQIIIAGGKSAITHAQNQLTSQGFTVIPLPVSAAFHTEYVAHAQQPFANFVNGQKFNKPQIPVYANSTGEPYPNGLQEIKTMLNNQILNPVYFKQQIENIHAAGGRIFIEFGPKGVLTNLVKTILKDKDHVAIALNQNAKKDSDLQFRQAVLQMRVLGLPLQNVDANKREQPLPAPKNKLTVALSGNNYVSEKTQKIYQDALTDGFKISGGTQIIEKEVEKIIEKIVEVKVPVTVEKIVEIEKIVEVPVSTYTNQNLEAMNQETLAILQSTLASFQANQTKSLEIFERFMNQQNEQAQQLINLLANQIQSSATAVSAPQTAAAIASSTVPALVQSGVKANGNGSNGNGYNNGSVAVAAPPKPTMVVQAPTPATGGGTGLDAGKITEILMEVVSEKTGYPAEMLELSMDMEADLGIDSIKRVEIFGALTAQYAELSGVNPNELTELRTLQEIVNYVVNAVGGNSVLQTEQPIPVSTSTSTSSTPSADGMDEGMKTTLMEVVSEKTGYPAEMLELDMDMEADLGIDSIKRVEIFGALTSQYAELSGINPNELTELRTLREIVNYVSSKKA